MSEPLETPRLPETGRVDRPMAVFWQLTKTWLRAPDRGNARWLVLALVVLTIGQVLVQMRFNLWNRDFFNALENRDGAAFRWQIIIFFGLAASSMAVAVYQLYTKQLIQLAWREWLTRHMLEAWLKDGRQYQLEMAGEGADNPDQRIAEDIRVSVDLAVDFVGGLLTSSMMLVAFIGILWAISGPLHLGFIGMDVTIPGYMVWAALLYAVIGTTLTMQIGRAHV